MPLASAFRISINVNDRNNPFEEPLTFPITGKVAQSLFDCSCEAPFGQGEKTVQDKTVRDGRQLVPDQWKVVNSDWNGALASVLETIKPQLGIPSEDLVRIFQFVLSQFHIFPF